MATSTPWGLSQQSNQIARGIVNYSTAGHGGIHLTRSRVASMPAALQLYLQKTGGITSKGDAWLEEDEQWAFACIAFPSEFDERDQKYAERTLRDSFPDAWEAFYGRKLSPGESVERDRETFYSAHRESLLVITAWGSWAPNVPKGMVGVCARKGGWQQPSDGTESFWLVPDAEYEARTGLAFVVDPTRHQAMNGKPF